MEDGGSNHDCKVQILRNLLLPKRTKRTADAVDSVDMEDVPLNNPVGLQRMQLFHQELDRIGWHW